MGLEVTNYENNKGVLVTNIKNKESKLIQGDIITEVNRERIYDIKNFKILIEKIKKTGRSSLLLKIIRDKESIWITIKFKENWYHLYILLLDQPVLVISFCYKVSKKIKCTNY